MNVTKPEGTTITYSSDKTNYRSVNPSFTEAGTYTVYYRITKDNYDTIEASKTVTIKKQAATLQPTVDATATPQPTESVTATIQPPKAETGTTEQLKNGDLVQDDNGTAKYEILDTAKKEVAYKEPVNKKVKTVTISATVKIGGVTYKVTGIADGAFKGNNTVTKISVGSNVASIGQNVFNGCKKLKTIMIKSTKLTAKTVSKNAYKGLTKATTIKVPKKKLTAYKKLFKQKGLSSKLKVKGY